MNDDIINLPLTQSSAILSKHQTMVRAAAEFHRVRQELRDYVSQVRVDFGVPEDNESVRWIMREDATAFLGMDSSLALDFTKPVAK